MKVYDWNEAKNDWLKKNRDISFDDVVEAINGGALVEVRVNPNKKRKGQKVFILWLKNYLYLVPFVEANDKYFLKTIYPSRKAMKYFGGKDEKNTD